MSSHKFMYQKLSGADDDKLSDVDDNVINSNCLQKSIDEIGLGRFQLWVFYVMGFRLFVNNTKQTLFALLEPSLKCYWHLNTYEGSSLTMAFYIGLMIGNTFMGMLSD